MPSPITHLLVLVLRYEQMQPSIPKETSSVEHHYCSVDTSYCNKVSAMIQSNSITASIVLKSNGWLPHLSVLSILLSLDEKSCWVHWNGCRSAMQLLNFQQLFSLLSGKRSQHQEQSDRSSSILSALIVDCAVAASVQGEQCRLLAVGAGVVSHGLDSSTAWCGFSYSLSSLIFELVVVQRM